MAKVQISPAVTAFRIQSAVSLLAVAAVATFAHYADDGSLYPVFLVSVCGATLWGAGQLRGLQRRAAKLEAERDALRDELRDMACAVSASTAGMARVDERGYFIWINSAYAEMLGYEADELVGTSAEARVHPDDLERAIEAYGRVGREDRASAELRSLARDDSVIFTRIDLARSLDPEGRPGIFVFAQDLTESREIEAALALKSSELARLNTELEQFAYVAAHDLREPARKVISFASLLEQDFEGELPEKAARDLHFITDAARRMQDLVQDLLALSRASRSAMSREQISLDDCVDTALDALALKLEESGAEMVRDELGEVEGDRTLLNQLYQNLISNALKFCDAEHPRVHITAEKTEAGTVFGVRDNGIGIESDYVKQIFQPFKRLHGRGEYEGTGIGLAICQKAAERHQGQIWVESEAGKGSHFKFTLGFCGGN